MYVYNVLLHWVCILAIESCLFLVSCLREFVCELSGGSHLLVSISLCILRVRDKWPFLGTQDHCLLHHYIHWWFNCSSWLDLSGLTLIHFPSIYLFLSWYFIRFAYIVLCSYQFTFRVRYFPHIIFIHLISSSILFLYSLSSLMYSSWILSSSSIYSYWTSSDPWFRRLSAHIAFYTRGYGVLLLGIWVLFLFISFTLLP